MDDNGNYWSPGRERRVEIDRVEPSENYWGPNDEFDWFKDEEHEYVDWMKDGF
jgi:hypothetical protein